MTNSLVQEAAAEAGINQKTIGGRTYSLKLLPARKGMAMGKRIIQAFGPALGVILDSNAETDVIFGEEQNLCTDLAIAIVGQLDELAIEQTVLDLLGGMTCDGQPIAFDSHFAAKYTILLEVITWAIKENFGDFFTGWLKAKGLSIPTLKSMMTSAMSEEKSDKSNEE